jgi:hypothetical protein
MRPSSVKSPIYLKVIESDDVAILWIQDKQKIQIILDDLPKNFQIVIMVCPQHISLGTYIIKIFTTLDECNVCFIMTFR